MKRLPAILVVAAAAVLLSSCTSEVTQENIVVTPGQTGTFSSGDTTVVVEPEASSGTTSAADANYLGEVRGKLGGLASATDEQLLSWGRERLRTARRGGHHRPGALRRTGGSHHLVR